VPLLQVLTVVLVLVISGGSAPVGTSTPIEMTTGPFPPGLVRNVSCSFASILFGSLGTVLACGCELLQYVVANIYKSTVCGCELL